jgi:glycosyltransferase involved in cell wall biosynthesis
MDIWIIKATAGEKGFACPSICWLPIHFEPVEVATVTAADLFDTIVTLSHDGNRKLQAIFPEKKVLRIPHVIDLEHFSLTAVNRSAVRKALHVPEHCFLVTIVYNLSESTSRKAPEVALAAFKIFNRYHPGSRLYIHSRLDDGIAMEELLDKLELRKVTVVSNQDKMATGGYPFGFVVNLMKVSDVVFNATASEGFGICSLEAQAIGTPVVVADSTAMPDNLFNGELCKVFQKKFCLQNTSYWFIPDVEDAAWCIEKIYRRTPSEKKRLARHGMKIIRENYNLRTLYDAWEPLFSSCETTLHSAGLRPACAVDVQGVKCQ